MRFMFWSYILFYFLVDIQINLPNNSRLDKTKQKKILILILSFCLIIILHDWHDMAADPEMLCLNQLQPQFVLSNEIF